MVEAFVAFVRFEEKLLLLRRNKSDGDFPALWDGVWGIADTQEECSPGSLKQPAFLSKIYTTIQQVLSEVSIWDVR